MSSPRHSTEDAPSESTPLLARVQSSGSLEDQPSQQSISGRRRPWPTIIALSALSGASILVLIFVFIIPQSVQSYAVQAATVDLDSVVPEFTPTGVRARVQGTFMMDSSRVESGLTRAIGIVGTWIARKVETGESQVDVSLPEYGNVAIGKALVPPVKVDIRNGRQNFLDFAVDLVPPQSTDGIRAVANDWLEGKMDHLRVLGNARVKLRSGFISLPTQDILQAIVIKGNHIPEIPQFNVTKLNFHEGEQDGIKGMEADASIAIKNKFPLDVEIPPLKFDILVPNCLPDEPYIQLADATLKPLHILPKTDLMVNATGFVREIDDSLTDECPHTGKSPLDTLLGGYVRGKSTTIFVRGSKEQADGTPRWLIGLLSDVTVPVPFEGHTFENIIHNFSLTDVEFKLPGFLAEPDSPESNPRISANINAWISLPEEMNFNADVNRIRATADVLYRKQKFGELNLRKWQPAKSHRVENPKGGHPFLVVDSAVKNTPLTITDDDIFTEVVQALLFGGKSVTLAINANVDVEVGTALGILTVREIPASGKVPVDPITGGGLAGFSPTINSMKVVESSKDTLTLEANVSVENPTNYSAIIPFADVNILANGTILGHATAKDLSVHPGRNEGMIVQAVWGQVNSLSGTNKTVKEVGREVLSQFVSGFNLTLNIQTHKGTIPSLPKLGLALQRLNITIPTPHISFPNDPNDPDDGDDDDDPTDDKPHFIKSATMHLFSSTADFTLVSPLTATTIYITSMNGTAYYEADEVGTIIYDLPFAVPPGVSVSPRLPVDWDLGSVGYDAVRKALGGELKLRARAEVGVRIGEWEELLWYEGKGIGAKVRL